jgi:TatD DNase family protein
MIDSHSHIYAEEFDADIAEAIQRAKDAGIKHIILPNVDSESLPRMLALETNYPNYCSAAIGLHPTSVKSDYQQELKLLKSELERRSYIAVGEIGIDLYWDKTLLKEQIICFKQQIEWALEYNLPIIIHTRNSFRETMNALQPYKNKGLKGVFHSFTGSLAEAEEMLELGGFLLGINGIVTFKNSGLAETVSKIDIQNIILETDSPYLTPTPYRGKRNESAYLAIICKKVAEIYNISAEEVSKITIQNSLKLFKIS